MVQPPAGTLFADPAHPAQPLPADVTPEVEAQPSFRDRGQFRRRLRYLRRVRELGFRDLGGLVFDLHRFQRSGDELIAGKLAALDAVDRELRALERVLRDEQAFTDLREPGIAACARCGALHGSDARFCPSCGVSLTGPRTLSELPVVAPSPVTAPVAEPIAPLTWGAAAPAAAAPVVEPVAAAPTPAAPVAEPVAATPAAPVAEPETEVVPPVAEEAPAPEAAEPPTEVAPPVVEQPAVDKAPAAPAPPAAEADVPDAEAPAEPADEAGPEVVVSAAESGDEPVSAAAHGLPVPPPPPAPPLPGEADGDQS